MLDGKLMHAELRIGDSLITVAEPFPGSVAPDPEQPVPASLLLYTEDVDAVYARAVQAGATPVNEPADQFHGDRAGSLRDPFGHRWMLATHTEDMTEAEMQRRMEEAMSVYVTRERPCSTSFCSPRSTSPRRRSSASHTSTKRV